jgi:endonuclease-3
LLQFQVVGMSQAERAEKVGWVHRRLLESYGEPEQPAMDPIATLVCTILSQNTNDTLRDKAYACLRARFPTWEQVRDAPVADIVAAIRTAGLAQQKGQHIKAALQRITVERGELNIGFLAGLPIEEARAWLTAMDGVGPKTAAIVLLFALDQPAFPVDTHVQRVSTRLGLIPKTSAEKAHVLLEGLVPPAWYYPFHLNVITHGRRVCAARAPQCAECALAARCDYFQAKG